MQACRTLSRREQAWHVRHLGISVHSDTSHHVVSSGPYFHRFLGNVNVGKLLELVIHTGQLLLYMLGRVRNSLLDPRNVQEHTAVRTAPPFANLPPDAAGHVVAGQQLGRALRVLVALRVTPPFFFRIGGLAHVQRRNIFEHESSRRSDSAARLPRRALLPSRECRVRWVARSFRSGGTAQIPCPSALRPAW